MGLIYENKQVVENLVKYLYNNCLKEDEIKDVLSQALNNAFLKGVDSGCVLQRNNTKRIKLANDKIRKRKFDEWYDHVVEEMMNLEA